MAVVRRAKIYPLLRRVKLCGVLNIFSKDNGHTTYAIYETLCLDNSILKMIEYVPLD
jgi:hypothetical protein